MINICQVDTIVKIINLKERIPICYLDENIKSFSKEKISVFLHFLHNITLSWKLRMTPKFYAMAGWPTTKNLFKLYTIDDPLKETIRDKFLLTKKLMKKLAERIIYWATNPFIFMA